MLPLLPWGKNFTFPNPSVCWIESSTVRSFCVITSDSWELALLTRIAPSPSTKPINHASQSLERFNGCANLNASKLKDFPRVVSEALVLS